MANYKVNVENKEYEVTVTSDGSGGANVRVEGEEFKVSLVGQAPVAVTPAATVAVAAPAAAPKAAAPAAAGAGAIVAPIPGVILKILVKVGDQVTAGQKVVVLEAMKMENDITTTAAGEVKEVSVSEGDQVSDGQALLVVG